MDIDKLRNLLGTGFNSISGQWYNSGGLLGEGSIHISFESKTKSCAIFVLIILMPGGKYRIEYNTDKD